MTLRRRLAAMAEYRTTTGGQWKMTLCEGNEKMGIVINNGEGSGAFIGVFIL